jgi:hypothetical protein
MIKDFWTFSRREVLSSISHKKYLLAPGRESRSNFGHILGYDFMLTMPIIKQLRNDLLIRQQEAMTTKCDTYHGVRIT